MKGFLVAALVLASEGKWTPQQVQALGPRWVKEQGFTVPLKTLWDARAGTGLLANAVQLPGCSGSFVSRDGLLITNHHCAVGVLQEHSTVADNILEKGFVARTRDEEKRSSSYRILVPAGFHDVTEKVRAAIPEGADDVARFKAVDRAGKALTRTCEEAPATRCTFARMEGGLSYTLTEFRELSDVRLVYAPPEALGNFGGEVDNWSWPRHTADFALLRAYQDGKPYTPPVFFPVSRQGVKPEDAVAVLGYPGVTYREALADEMAEREARFFPAVGELAREWLAIRQAEASRSKEVAVAVAAENRSLENRRKNAEGQLAGFRRGSIVERQRAAEQAVLQFAARRPELASAVAARDGLLELLGRRMATWARDFLLDVATGTGSAKALSWSLTVVRHAVESTLPDEEREVGYQARDLARLKERLERDQKQYAPAVDRKVLVWWLARAAALPAGQRLEAVDRLVGPSPTPQRLEEVAARLSTSPVLEAKARLSMLEETPAALEARNDPLLSFALALDVERRAVRDERDAMAGRALVLRPAWRKAVLAHAGRPLAPDANSTLRVSFCRVKGYRPRDGILMTPQTSLAGVVEKATGTAPFVLPEAVRVAAGKAGPSWRDPRLGDVPVNFLADCDTTGGNSGSPVIDGKGRLVGVNFDRVWENVANDFGYNPEVARNVVVDARYLLWLLEEVEGATGLVTELTAP